MANDVIFHLDDCVDGSPGLTWGKVVLDSAPDRFREVVGVRTGPDGLPLRDKDGRLIPAEHSAKDFPLSSLSVLLRQRYVKPADRPALIRYFLARAREEGVETQWHVQIVATKFPDIAAACVTKTVAPQVESQPQKEQ